MYGTPRTSRVMRETHISRSSEHLTSLGLSIPQFTRLPHPAIPRSVELLSFVALPRKKPNQHFDHQPFTTANMRFAPILAGFAALVAAQDTTTVVDTTSIDPTDTAAISSIASSAASVSSVVSSALESVSTSAESELNSISTSADSVLSSFSSAIATATGADRDSLTSELAGYTSTVASRVSSATEAAGSASSSATNAGPQQTAAVAMGALFGGAALLANF